MLPKYGNKHEHLIVCYFRTKSIHNHIKNPYSGGPSHGKKLGCSRTANLLLCSPALDARHVDIEGSNTDSICVSRSQSLGSIVVRLPSFNVDSRPCGSAPSRPSRRRKSRCPEAAYPKPRFVVHLSSRAI